MIGSEFQSHVTPPEGFQALVIGSFRKLAIASFIIHDPDGPEYRLANA